MVDLEARKDAHLSLCATAEVEPKENSALFEHMHFVHDALPELSLGEIDTEIEWLGKRLAAPLLITGMTGGTPRAQAVNRALAAAAESCRVAFGVGSQRAMLEAPERAETYQVRDVAPHALLLGNIGIDVATKLSGDELRKLAHAIGADGLALHLNSAQELFQPEGLRDFHGGVAAITRAIGALGNTLVVKETGCGLSPSVQRRLAQLGVKNLDISGLGGTSWIRVEQLRSSERDAQQAAQFSGWGIPTAAALAAAPPIPSVFRIASGGIRTGIDVAKSLALGANLCGAALPFFKAAERGGAAEVRREVEAFIDTLRRTMLLVGAPNLAALARAPRLITGTLADWVRGLQEKPIP